MAILSLLSPCMLCGGLAMKQRHSCRATPMKHWHSYSASTDGTLTAPVLMALLQRQYWWHSYSASTNGTLTAPIQSRLTGTLTVPTLSAGTLTVPRVSMAPPACSGQKVPDRYLQDKWWHGWLMKLLLFEFWHGFPRKQPSPWNSNKHIFFSGDQFFALCC